MGEGDNKRYNRRNQGCHANPEHAEAAWIAGMIDQLLGGVSFHALESGCLPCMV